MIRSHSLVFSDFNSKWYKRWADELNQSGENLGGWPLRANKFWQNAVMAQILYEKHLLGPTKTAVGFGVGQERLPALFAKHGVKVMATDQEWTAPKAKHWQKNELASGASSLNKFFVCPPQLFKANVSFKATDMTKIPGVFAGQYDFAWSNCALGHLGSIEAGLHFIVESAKCLKPSGLAVHTTEVNVLSDTETVDLGDTVIFRPQDIYRLSQLLWDEGYELEPLRLTFGRTARDRAIAMRPQFGSDYSKLQVGSHLITQVVLIIKPFLKASRLSRLLYRRRHERAYRNNLKCQRLFAKRHPFLQSIRRYEATDLADGVFKPLSKTLSVTLKEKPAYFYLEYENTTDFPVFGLHPRFYSTKPISLATSSPTDRQSPFKADDWHNDQANRPSVSLFAKGSQGAWSEADFARPHSRFAYRIKLDGSKMKKGVYDEKFVIVQEGVKHLAGSEISLSIRVT